MNPHLPEPLACHRCGQPLVPGSGNFYVVRIEALADPTPPHFTEEDLRRDVRDEWERLLQQMGHLSEQEALDQVYRQMMLYLCEPCYRHWIANPVGREPSGCPTIH